MLLLVVFLISSCFLASMCVHVVNEFVTIIIPGSY